MENEKNLRKLIRKSHYEIPDRNFEDKVMEKIAFVAGGMSIQRKNLRLSWIFLGVSASLLGIILSGISRSSLLTHLSNWGLDLSSLMPVLMPAGVLIAAVIILLQVDNLYRLTQQLR